MPVHTLTLRLDEETDEALRERCEAEPGKATAEVIREAILEKGACVYFVRRSDRAVKVGFTGAIRSRLSTLKAEVGDVTLEAAFPGGRAEEKALHKKLAKDRLTPRGEWFRGPLVEAELASVLAEWGPPDVEVLGAASSVSITFKVTEEENAQLEGQLRSQNARLAAEGMGATVTLSGFVRALVVQGLEARASGCPRAVQEAVVESGQGSQSDETVVREPVHRKRVRQVPSPVVEAPRAVPEVVEGAPEEGDLEGMADLMVKGAPL